MSDRPKDLAPFPERSNAAEMLLTATKAAASLGIPGADLLDLLRLPIQKRQTEWLNELAERLRVLEAKARLSVEDVTSNPRFQDAIVAAVRSVGGIRDEDKRNALRNAILNIALGASDDVQQDLFLQLVDRFTVWHIRLLKVFADPESWAAKIEPKRVGHSTESFLGALFPELAERLPYCKLIWRDLHQAGLVSTDEISMFDTMTNTPSWRHKRASDLGRDFLRFIEEPTQTQEGPGTPNG